MADVGVVDPVEAEAEAGQLRSGIPPDWADAWGRDRFGVFASFRIGEVEQRMRWIAADSFLMGSPADDDESFGDEQPQHRVRISRGFWLADTPCTQALWVAVMGDNPSRFEGPQRPVEQVSWNDCQKFCDRIGERVGAAMRLPTEAEWEYASRSDTDGARYGELERIAWFDDTSEGQTHDVAGKDPSAWGLYDMIGNVWEWCLDAPRDYAQAAVVDPFGLGPFRVYRGGSWADPARNARAACRYWSLPGIRFGALGFRLARGQDPRSGQQAVERVGTRE